MAMAVDSRQQQQQSQFNTMGYDAMRYPAGPQFTNPWVSAAPGSSQMYATSMPPSNEQRYAHAPNASAPYSAGPISAPALASGIFSTMDQQFLEEPTGLHFAQDGLSAARPTYPPYTTHPTTASTFAPTSAPTYAAQYHSYQADRRPSHPSVATALFLGDDVDLAEASALKHAASRQDSFIDTYDDRFNTTSEAERQGFNDAMDASRGMLAMSQSDITPRNIYGNQQPNSSRSSTDSYGFPATHSSHSSISSGSYPTYYNSSVSEASVGDYSSASESVDMPSSRTLPKPLGLVGGGSLPPAPQSMMGQFSSKVSSSSQKKHKCKICDKRFTRPSSLQTHMYSHTGEKREYHSHQTSTSITTNVRSLL